MSFQGAFVLAIIIVAGFLSLAFVAAILKNIVLNPRFYIYIYSKLSAKAVELRSDEHALRNAQQAVEELRKRGYVVRLQVSKEPVPQDTGQAIPA